MSTLTAVRGSEPWKRRLYLPAYQVSDAAHYASTSVRTISYWQHGGGQLGPPLPGRERRQPLSYLQLVEVAFVATFRLLGVSLQRIRRAREYAAQTLHGEYPFVDYRWQTEGYHVLLDLREVEREAAFGRLIVGDAHGQLAWQPLVVERFGQFDYVHELAVIWHVAGRGSAVVIDPRVSFGAPTVSGVPTWAIKGRYDAGESLNDILDDFGLTEDQLEDALRFEGIDLQSNGHSIFR